MDQETKTSSKGVVFTFGRFQPCTIGHELLIKNVLNQAKQHGYDHVIHLSKSHDSDKNPLPWSTKYAIMTLIFPGVNFSRDESIINPFQALEQLSSKYKNIIFVGGDDRTEYFSQQMPKYAQEWGVENFQVSSVGKRNNVDSVSSASATKARTAIRHDDFEGFMKLMPSSVDRDMGHTIFNILKRSIN